MPPSGRQQSIVTDVGADVDDAERRVQIEVFEKIDEHVRFPESRLAQVVRYEHVDLRIEEADDRRGRRASGHALELVASVHPQVELPAVGAAAALAGVRGGRRVERRRVVVELAGLEQVDGTQYAEQQAADQRVAAGRAHTGAGPRPPAQCLHVPASDAPG